MTSSASDLVTVDVVVVGAGVVGLACARALAMRGLQVAVFERETHFGQGISSRSSEVIHAGLYYPTGSLKAELCVPGSRALYDYCATRQVPHQRVGKLVVATDSADLPALERIASQARANGVEQARLITGDAARNMASELRCCAALWSPDTGIVDSHALMQALADDAEQAGAMLMYGAPVIGGECAAAGQVLQIGGAVPYRVEARWLVNAAGFGAQTLAGALQGFPAAAVPPLYFAKGHYFALSGRNPFKHLIYPVPEPGGLGTHLTLDLAGNARFGPDVEWVDAPDYSVPTNRAQAFANSIRRYWPDVAVERLQPAYAGVRPKLGGPDAPAHDFRIDGPAGHGVPGVVQLFGIESPGLTASLAIAARVSSLVGG
ncbi:NAD(P)/FAD-dependent oxidoreductase [Niveibacterium microcysteis]|uniref:NAD(P)/FAD-dependent oxidoreductase n=1 Tax=Niveibacterium microcysteis TaxID=2811415 RepID=A0ABX7MA13_9RHOO|nr:NAD(P)/FAD-dependent oxidoreductase [Niveibacterium microcysteis]QSI78224.1 NAD(P)/FAD-dependent oxidoreductase [Niveibacterium microcysteis]